MLVRVPLVARHGAGQHTDVPCDVWCRSVPQIVLWTAVFTSPDNSFRSYVAGETSNFGSAHPPTTCDLIEVADCPRLARRLQDDATEALVQRLTADTKQGGSPRFKHSLSLLRQGPLSLSPAHVRPVIDARPPNAASSFSQLSDSAAFSVAA